MIYDVNTAIHHNEKNLIQITGNLINSFFKIKEAQGQEAEKITS